MTVPTVLLILDGWGLAPPGKGNAIHQAKLTTLPKLWRTFPHSKLRASGSAVGLPPKQHGNSEAGHINIGAGRIVEQDAVRINRAITEGTFKKNPAFLQALRHVKRFRSRLHLLGLMTGEGSGHAFPLHLTSLLGLAESASLPTFVHLFTDGRDTRPYQAVELLHRLERQLGVQQRIATVIGRFWAMDRAKRWSRTRASYDALTLGTGKKAPTPEAAILDAYQRAESDEFVSPTIIGSTAVSWEEGRIRNADAVIFFHLRSDRARQLTKPFVQPDFEKRNPGSWKRHRKLQQLFFAALTEFGPDLPSMVTAFPSITLKNTLPMQLSDLRQLYLAESEKYAHITYFMNGGYAQPVGGEVRQMVRSANVRSFADRPSLETPTITDSILKALKNHRYDIIVANFANADMVGHTGNLTAGMAAAKVVDRSVARLTTAIRDVDGQLFITGDHGNLEKMLDEKTGQIDTEHSSSLVPFFMVKEGPLKIRSKGFLADVAPTILHTLHRTPPKAMTGHSLLR